MFEQLKAHQGKNVIIELSNGRMLSGTVLSVDQQAVRLETNEGTGSIPLQSVFIVWETLKRSVDEENIEKSALPAASPVDPPICRFQFGGPGPGPCRFQFGGIGPGPCRFQFGGPCRFEFGEPCRFQFGGPCRFEFGEPCRFQFGGPCRFEFGLPCRFEFSCVPFLFGCGPFTFGQPCTFAFGCGSFQFGQACVPFPFGSQCGGFGGFTCAGAQFFGVV